MADPTVTIAGTDRTAYVRAGSCRISKQLNGRASADITIIDEAGAYKPALGNTVVVAKDGVTYFAGQVREIRTKVPPGTDALESSVRVLDYTSLLDRRLVSATYENMTLYAIVAAIITDCFGGDGITIANVENPGPTITEKIVFAYCTGTAAFQQLSTITGYQFYIDADKDLHFSQFTSNAAPFGLTDDSGNWSDLDVSTGLNAYRNRQFVRTEHKISFTRNETFAGDDATATWPLKYPCADKPTILLDGAAVDVYNYGVLAEAGNRWYWENVGVGRIWSCNADGTPLPLASGSTIEIGYPAIWDNVAVVEDTSEIAARAAAEGDSGVWEAVREERNLDSIAALEAVGDGELRRNGSVPTQISFRTDTAGLEPGQKIPIQNTLHGLNDDYLIESVDYEWVAALRGDFFRHSVKCSNKEVFQSTGTGSGVAALASYMTRVADVARVGPTTTTTTTGSTSSGGGASASTLLPLPPVLADWTQINGTSCTFLDLPTGVLIRGPADADKLHGLAIALPAAPWTLTAEFRGTFKWINYAHLGLWLLDGTGKIIDFTFMYNNGNKNGVQKWTNANTYASDFLPANNVFFHPTFGDVARIVDDGTNLLFQFSCDGSEGSFETLYSVGRTAYMASGPTQIGFFVSAYGSGAPVTCVLRGWKLTRP